MVKLETQQYTLKPIEVELNAIRNGLRRDADAATGKKKTTLLIQVKKMDKLIALLKKTCKAHTMGDA